MTKRTSTAYLLTDTDNGFGSLDFKVSPSTDMWEALDKAVKRFYGRGYRYYRWMEDNNGDWHVHILIDTKQGTAQVSSAVVRPIKSLGVTA